jgi:hypothetical protein
MRRREVVVIVVATLVTVRATPVAAGARLRLPVRDEGARPT